MKKKQAGNSIPKKKKYLMLSIKIIGMYNETNEN